MVSSMGAASVASAASCVSASGMLRGKRGDSWSSNCLVVSRPGRRSIGVAAAAVRGNHDDNVDGGFERTRLECRTSVGVRLERRLREEGSEAFAKSADAALSALASSSSSSQSGFMDRATSVGDLRVGFMDADDLSVGREALKRMEVEDIMYLSAARDVIEAGADETSSASSSSSSTTARVRLMHRCQKLQTMLPDGSDDLLINLIVRVIENVSQNSKKIGVTYAVPASTLADVYKKCATFGYFLQSSKRRLELEHFVPTSMESIDLQVLAYPRKMVRYGILSANLKAMEGEDVVVATSSTSRRVSGYKVPVQLRVPGGYQIADDLINLKEYIDEMGPQARAQAARISSVEANDVLQMHVSSLFDGNVGHALTSSGQFRRKHRTNCSTGHCVVEERVAIHLNQLKHLILEACAFGAALAKTEHSIDNKFDEPLLTRQ